MEVKKIRTLESATIVIDNGHGEIHIKESYDGIFNVELVENTDDRIRLGIRDEHGIEFKFLRSFQSTTPKD
jgi:hypothetical protein